MTHDEKRHDVTTLFAVLNALLDGTVIGTCKPRDRREYLAFLMNIVKQTLPDLNLHPIIGSSAKYDLFHVAQHGRAFLLGDHARTHLARHHFH
jgi:hypothetical protein